ncbi:MAG: hypothetical protein O7E54_09835 [Planctomycetota bacterium]|nr:hypothetical protein [Planctomycetota bacterium]
MFIHIQTVWEGTHTNTPERGPKEVKKYRIRAPNGFDAHVDGASTSITMRRFGTGGTPWTIIIDKRGMVRLNEVTPGDVDALAKKIEKFRKGG